MAAPHLLIIGSGSVGKRHARNFSKLGCRISCMDPRADRVAELAAEVPVVAHYASEVQAYSAATFDGVVIASPPVFHVDQTLGALQQRLPVLLEKPSSPDLPGTQKIVAAAKQSGVPVLLGYTWRWWPPLSAVREILAAGELGALRYVQFHMSAHLADWHPWERYQDFFMAQRALGGGALLDESHWIDLMLWLFGMPRAVFANVGKLSSLEIDSDDSVDMICSYPGFNASLHLDLFGRPHEKFIRFVGERGTLLWTADPNRISVSSVASGWERVQDFSCERNDMFVAVARDYLALLGGARDLRCTIEDGARALRVIEAARRSNEGRVEVTLD